MRHSEQPVVVVLGGEDSHRLVADAVAEQALRIEWLREPVALGDSTVADPAAVLVDQELVGDPEAIREWIQGGRLRPAVPLLLLAGNRPDAATLQRWLQAGVWDVVSVPVDPHLLGLRIRNLLGHRRPLPGHSWILPHRPYSWSGLVRATDETLDLCRRHDRPLACVAIVVHGQATEQPDAAARLRKQLGVATQEWVRGSDLVGLSDSGLILVVLPDTPIEEARRLATRLVATLERRLRRWGMVARLGAHACIPSPDDPSAAEFLLSATRTG